MNVEEESASAVTSGLSMKSNLSKDENPEFSDERASEEQ